MYVTFTILFANHVQASSSPRRYDLATRRLVLADYLNDWSNPSVSIRWDGWDYGCGKGHDPNHVYPNGTRDIASVYYPIIGPYDAGDDAVMEYHIRLAQAAGIDGFVVEWDGTKIFHDFPDVNSRFERLLKTAERLGFGVAVLYDAYRYYVGSTTKPQLGLIPNRPEVLRAIHDDLAFVIREYGSSALYLRFNGKPVIFSGNGIDSLKPTEWAQVFQILQNEGLTAYYASQGDQSTLSYYPQYQGFSPWISVGAILRGDTTPLDFINDQTSTIRRFGRGISWGVSVWPGFDDSPVQGWCTSTRQVDRAKGKLYNLTWTAAIQNKPTWIYIITFNDWNEGTIIEPSMQFGYQYLAATAYYTAKFKNLQTNYSAIPVPFLIYNATLAVRQAQTDGRIIGLDAANQTLQQAEQAFQFGQYSEATSLAKQATMFALQATAPPSTTSSSVSYTLSMPQPPVSSTRFDMTYAAAVVLVVIFVAASVIALVRKRESGKK